MSPQRPHSLSRCFPWAIALPLALLVTLSGCAAPAPSASGPGGDVVKVFKNRGALQCEGRGTPPEAMRAELERAGVRVQASACGSDGRMRPAVCGAGTGEINLFDIAAADLPGAQALGFAPLSQLRDAQAVPCR